VRVLPVPPPARYGCISIYYFKIMCVISNTFFGCGAIFLVSGCTFFLCFELFGGAVSGVENSFLAAHAAVQKRPVRI
jgi:hypothetical protein